MEWLRFVVVALFLLASLGLAVVSVAGVFKFKFILNRMHAAAIIDTLGLFFIVLGLIIANGFVLEDGSFDITNIKLACVVFFLWLTSPVSSHLIAKLIYMTDAHTDEETEEVEIDVNDDGGINHE